MVKKLSKKQQDKIEYAYKNLVNVLNTELGWFDKEALKNTPVRCMKFIKEWVEDNKFDFTVFPVDKDTAKSMVWLNNIKFYSMCSHHILPFSGVIHIAYLPDENKGMVCGISKLARVVKKFASKPQMQEKMTNEIADYLMDKLKAWFIIVIIESTHLCMTMRGIRQHDSIMKTSAIRWDKNEFTKEQIFGIKDEAMKLIIN